MWPYLLLTFNQVKILQRNLFENLFNIDQFNKYLKTVVRIFIYVLQGASKHTQLKLMAVPNNAVNIKPI